MSLRDVFIIGVALAMDAFGVSISIGLGKNVNRENKIGFIISFAIFQFLFFFCGGVFAYFFEKYVTSIPNLIGGIVIMVVGIMMIKEGIESNDDEGGILTKGYMYIVLGISVSIDALVVGFTTLHNNSINYTLIYNSAIIGFITLIICTIGFYLCRYIRKVKFISKYANFLGGIMLLLFGIKMIFL